MPHALDHDFERRSRLFARGNGDGRLFHAAIDGRDQLAVKIDVRVIVNAVEIQRSRGTGGNGRAVERQPLILSERLEIRRGLEFFPVFERLKTVAQIREKFRREIGDFDDGNRSGNGRELFLAFERVGDDLTVLVIFLGRAPLLVNRRAVVVARQIRVVVAAGARVVVRSRGEAEIRAAVDGENAEGAAGLHEPADVPGKIRRPPVAFAPAPEPTRIGFRGKDGNARIFFVGDAPRVVVQPRIEPDADVLVRINHPAEVVMRRAVGHVKRREALLRPELFQPAQVFGLFAEPAPVLVFDLRHQNRAAVFEQIRLGDFRDRPQVALLRLHESLVLDRADFRVLVLQQIRGKPAEIPFAANVRAGTEKHPHAVVFAELKKRGDVAAARLEVEGAVGLLEIVPHRVERDGVESHRLAHFDAVIPIFARNALRMKFPAANLERLAVEQENAVFFVRRIFGERERSRRRFLLRDKRGRRSRDERGQAERGENRGARGSGKGEFSGSHSGQKTTRRFLPPQAKMRARNGRERRALRKRAAIRAPNAASRDRRN